MAIWIPFAIVFGLGATYFWLAWGYLRPKRKRFETWPESLTRDSASIDGHTVGFWRNTKANTQPVGFLLIHGYTGSPADHFAMGDFLASQGYAVAMPEMRAHGDNPHLKTGFGLLESHDLLNWLRHLKESSGVQSWIGYGASMGGAAVWLACEAEPGALSAVVTEGAFATLKEATDDWFDRTFPGARVALYPVRWIGTRLSGVRESEVVPERSATAWKGRPCVVLHGLDDQLFGKRHAERLASAAGIEVTWLQDSRHATGWDRDSETIAAELLRLAEIIANANKNGTKLGLNDIN